MQENIQTMDKEDLDIPLLQTLRDGFLGKTIGNNRLPIADYWTSRHALTQYHATFGQRIGWKWQAIIDQLKARNFISSPRILDFGCGTGVASLVWAREFKTESVSLWDRSSLSTRFAEEIIAAVAPPTILSRAPETFEGQFVLLSHVLNELPKKDLPSLMQRLATSDGFCWVEPGTPDSSQWLVSLRESLIHHFEAVAPCPHQAPCGLANLESKSEMKGAKLAWCHHFAPPPAEVFRSGLWKKFSDELKIDLRSLPTSFLVMRKKMQEKVTSSPSACLLGRPRFFKGYAHFWTCMESKVEERKIQYKHNRLLVKQLEDAEFSLTLNEAELAGSAPLKK